MQRVTRAQVSVGDEVVGAIGPGLCVLVGVTHTDEPTHAHRLAAKLLNLRIMDDDAGVMNRSVADTGGELLVVSQFTLYGDTSGGRRPSWIAAARPEQAEPLVDALVGELRRAGCSGGDGPVPHGDGRGARERRTGDAAPGGRLSRQPGRAGAVRSLDRRARTAPSSQTAAAAATTGFSPSRK